MTKTIYQPAPQAESEIREDRPKGPHRRRRILLISVAAIAILALVALVFGGAILVARSAG